MNILDYAGALCVLLLMLGAGVYSGSHVRSSEDFLTGGGRTGLLVLIGMTLGTMVGGSSTVGTAQMAFHHGLSAWWFTLGGGLGCLAMALFFAGPLRRSGCTTFMELIRREYGSRAGMAASVLCSVGMFINIISQLLAAAAILEVLFPGLPLWASLLIIVGCMLVYVGIGGMMGAGIIGVIKVLLLSLTTAACCIAVFSHLSVQDFLTRLEPAQYFRIFGRGILVDGGNGLSLVLGILTTQCYMQVVLSGKSEKTSIQALLISAVFMPLVGLGSIVVGEFMYLQDPSGAASQAFAQFVLTYLPAGLSGVVLATLLIALIGTGSGLALGVATVVERDILNRLRRRKSALSDTWRTRLCLTGILLIALAICLGSLGDMILDFAFMSMGLRGAVVMLPLCGALFLPNRLDRRWVLAGIILGPCLVLIFGLFPVGNINSLFLGLLGSAICCLLGWKRA